MTTPGRWRGEIASGGSGGWSIGATALFGATGGSARGGGRVGMGSVKMGSVKTALNAGAALASDEGSVGVGVPRLRSAANAASLRSG